MVGEDFLRRKTEGYLRRRNRGYARLVQTNLFSTAPATEATEAVGVLCASEPPPMGARVWPKLASDGSVSFFRGNDTCVHIPEARARSLRGMLDSGSVVGEVVASDNELGHVRLRLTRLDGGDARPSFS